MSKNTKVNAAILIIGNEILSGRTQDTNTSTLAVWLNSLGVQVNEVRVIPDTKKSLQEGAIAPWSKSTSLYYVQTLSSLSKHYKFSLDEPWKKMSKKIQDIILM